MAGSPVAGMNTCARDDQIAEIVLQFTNAGNATTGPLRTGMTIYDWNGAAYVQSITQLDPPRFRIQVIHEADRLLNRDRKSVV